MGICGSVESEASRRNMEIDNQLSQEQKKLNQEVKLLLLGAGESGKSTVLKQMKLLNDKPYTDEERRSLKSTINSNIIYSMKTICQNIDKNEQRSMASESKQYASLILEQPDTIPGGDLDPQLATAVQVLWKDPVVQKTFKRAGSGYHLNDSAKYYFDSLDRITRPDYLPTDQDILRSRVKTTGIVETTFNMKSLTYRMFDVGGQRSERKKWIHCFENVNAIIFLAAISEYDQKLVEDEEVNRMEEAFSLFDSIATSRWFTKTSIILFLNKMDIFEAKIFDSPIEEYFDDYEDGADIESGKAYFKRRFEDIMPEGETTRTLYTHFTCATDTRAMQFVMQAVYQIIQTEALKTADLI